MKTIRLHEERRTGKGTTDDPIYRHGHLCSYENCPDHGRIVRLTEGGFIVAYCPIHALQAELTFNTNT